jgi:hypothetical protein
MARRGQSVGARSGLEGHGESGFGTGMARFGLAVTVRRSGYGAKRLGTLSYDRLRFGGRGAFCCVTTS